MPTALWIALVDVTDDEKMAAYAGPAVKAIKAFGGEYLARGGKYVQLDGQDRSRNVVIRFPSLQAAQDCYNSDGYQEAVKAGAGGFTRDLVIVEELSEPI